MPATTTGAGSAVSRKGKGTALTTDPLLAELQVAVPDGVRSRATDRLALAHDASHYLLTPRAVVVPRSIEELGATLRTARHHDVPITFRSGGTSLSGQAVTDGLLIDTRKHFRDITVLDAGARVRVGPGVTVRQLNNRLLRWGRKFGPDPASEAACTIGGVVANNSSGMLCGTTANTYQTLESAVLVLPSGTVINTGDADADDRLRALEPELWQGLSRLRDRVRGNPDSVATITAQFAIKNTMGYGLNSFLDHDRPVDVLAHLVVGSEGTLAFVAEATFATVPDHRHVATGLLVFDDLHAANDALPALVDSGLAAIELLDAASLRVAGTDPLAPAMITDLAVERHAALLVEHQRADADELAEMVAGTDRVIGRLSLSRPGTMTSDPQSRKGFWHVRKGLYAAVAGARPSGTTALLEDIAVPVADLADTCQRLEVLFDRYEYPGSVIFGHAKDGNVHFLINERFDDPGRLERYDAFTEDMVELVLGRGGTLKAEHGTGRIMAPYVARQYGTELYEVMREVKRLCDPESLFNPGVLISDDPRAHVTHLKSTPTVEEEVDRCVECGYCEPVCPSKDLTLTPRQRIVLRREKARAEAAGDHQLAAELTAEYTYDGLETCAVDGMCKTACPVAIDTGDLVRRLRAETNPAPERALWATTAKSWGATTKAASLALDVAATVPDPVVTAMTDLGRMVLGHDTVPRWTGDLPAGGEVRRRRTDPDAIAVFVPSCTSTMFGPDDPDSPGAARAFLAVCDRAGVRVRIPDRIASLCCGTPWKSKGMTEGLAAMSERVDQALWEATDHGRLPVVVDATSCTEGLHQMIDKLPPDRRPAVVDAMTFVREHVIDRLPLTARIDSLVLHPTCSSTRLGTNDDLTAVAEVVAHAVATPTAWGCCGFAGDRGMLHPELTESATRAEAAEVAGLGAAEHASCNRTCEIGMSRATGRSYVHVLELLERCSRPA
ncbi:FAD-binding and (Fe-S)-binding domain-containing protein [Propionibacteriaceae bacterium Y2011]